MASNCENGAVFCEDFENIGANELPAGLSFRSCDGNDSYYDVTPNGALEGSYSVSLTAGANYCEAWLDIEAMQDLTAGYVRFRVLEESAKGGNRWFMLVENGPNADSNGNSLRMRMFDGNVLAWNVEAAGDTIAPDFYSPGQRESTVSLPTNETTCFEVFFDNANDVISIWMNDEPVPGLELDNDASTGFDQRFLNSYGGNFDVDVNLIRLGWEGSSAAIMAYDDIVVSESKIGCN